MSFHQVPYVVSIFNNILMNNISINKTNNDSLPYISEENKNEGYIYLLILDLIIFGSLTYTTYISYKKFELEKYKEEFMSDFIKWLVLANGMRTLSLIFIIIINNPNGNNGISWVNSILHIGPAFLFVSSYMSLAIRFSVIYYQNISYENHILKPTLSVIVYGGYFLLILIALITLFAKKYKVFFYISELLMAILYLVLGSIIIYYGKKVSEIFQSTTQNTFDSNDKYKRFTFISFSIGSLFLIKGISGVLGGIGAYDPKNHNIYDFFWFLILEVLPTVIYIRLSKINNSSNNNETPRSTTNDADLGSIRESTYKPAFLKE